jgi:hypothetical protein
LALPRRLAAAVLLVGLGRLLSPIAVPVYDGIGAPDEPYRYVAPPPGVTKTAAPTTAHSSSPLVKGTSSYGMSLATGESGPQFSLFVPPKALAAAGTTVELAAAPQPPTDQPAGARIDGNVYAVTLTAAGPVTFTPQAALATLYLRATTVKQPPPVMEYRAKATAPWTPLKTARGGQDVYVSSFPGAGDYALAFNATASSKGGSSPVPFVVIGGVVLLVVLVVVVRLRAAT